MRCLVHSLIRLFGHFNDSAAGLEDSDVHKEDKVLYYI